MLIEDIKKIFIFSGGRGKRLGLFKKNNIKAFAKVNSKELLINHIDNINKFLNVEKIFIIITENEDLFKNQLKKFNNVEIIFNKKDYSYKGINSGLKLLENHVENKEKFLVFLADEYYDEDDFKNFCLKSQQTQSNEILIAIKKYKFPQEYFKNYSVTLDQKNNLITDSIEKNNKINSEYFGTGLMCLNSELFQVLKVNNDKKPFYSIINNFKIPRYFELKNDYININTKVDLYNLQKKSNQNSKTIIDVIIPAYNEEESIKYVINDFKEVCDNVIVASKNPDDLTDKIILENKAKLVSDNFKGYGDAIKKGIEKSKADIIILSEADGTFRASDVEKLVSLLKESDLVIGTRTNPSFIQYGASMGPLKRFFNIVYGKIISILWFNRSVSLSDVGCTLRAFWREDYLEICKNIKSKDASFAPEHTIEFIEHGYRIIEIPVNYYPRCMGVSKISGTFFQSAITALKMLKTIVIKRIYYTFLK